MAMLHTGRDVQGIFIMLMVLIPALCIVMLIATIFHSSQQKTDCDSLLPRHACLVAWCMHGSMLQSNDRRNVRE